MNITIEIGSNLMWVLLWFDFVLFVWAVRINRDQYAQSQSGDDE